MQYLEIYFVRKKIMKFWQQYV